MAVPHEVEALSKAFSGMGVDEKTLISILGNSHLGHRRLFRKENPNFFIEDERAFERYDDHFVKHLKQEYTRFYRAVVLWAIHPWERDARLVKKALKKGPESYSIIVEVACTRSSEELLGARRAYHSLFDLSIEEDVASHIHGSPRKLLVALVSAYRYEGKKLKEDNAKSEAKILADAIKSDGQKAVENDEVVRILTTRSKFHLQQVYKYYKAITSTDAVGDIAECSILSDTMQCLFTPSTYFSKVLDASLSKDADKQAKKWLTRVIVTRADHADMKETIKEYHQLYGEPLAEKIQVKANGNYRDFLLTLLAKAN